MEEWKPLKYNEKYLISSEGKIKSLYTNRLLKPFLMKKGYLEVSLWINNKRKTFRVHKLVAETFIPNPNNFSQINHKDENKTNNDITNLEWCTPQYNHDYGARNLKTKKKICQMNMEGNVIKIWDGIVDIEKELHLFGSNITSVCKGRRKTYKGYKWKYML